MIRGSLAIAAASAEAIFRGVLQIEIDCRDEIVPGDRRLFFELSHLPAEAVHDNSLESVFTDEQVVVFALEPCFSDLISGLEIDELIRRKLGFGHFTDIAHRVRCDFVFHVPAARLEFHGDFRQFVAVCFHECDVTDGDVLFQDDWAKFRLAAFAVDAVQQLFLRHAHARAQHRRGLLDRMRTVFANQNDVV